MGNFEERAKELLKKYFDLCKKEKSEMLTSTEKKVWWDLVHFFDEIKLAYDKLSSVNSDDKQREVLVIYENILTEKERYDINLLNSNELESEINDFLKAKNFSASKKIKLKILVTEVMKRVNSIVSKVGLDGFLNKKHGSLTSEEETIYSEYTDLLNCISCTYNVLSFVNMVDSIDDEQREIIVSCEKIITEEQKRVISMQKSEILSKGIGALAKDNVPAVGKIRLKLLIEEALKRVDLIISKVGLDEFLNKYYSLTEKHLANKIPLTFEEQSIRNEYGILLDCITDAYNILKEKELLDILSDHEKEILINIENILKKDSQIMVSNLDNAKLHRMMSAYQASGIPALGKLRLGFIIDELSKRGEISPEKGWRM